VVVAGLGIIVMGIFIRFVASLSRLCGVIAASMVLVSVVVVSQMVLVRYVLEESTIWQTEFVTYLLIAATVVGSPYVLLTRGHVNVDLLPIYMSHKGRVVMALVAATVSFIFCAVLAWTGFEFWYEAWDNGWRSDTIWEVRLWIPYLAMPVGFGILSLQYVADILSLLTGRDMPFGIVPEKSV